LVEKAQFAGSSAAASLLMNPMKAATSGSKDRARRYHHAKILDHSPVGQGTLTIA